MLFGATVRATAPHGRITARRVPRRPGLVAADHRDIPGRNIVALIDDDQPCLAAAEVRHVAEPILLLAHADHEALPRPCTSHHRLRPASTRSRSAAVATVVQGDHHRQGGRRPRAWPRPRWSSRASTAPATRSSSTSRPTGSSPCRDGATSASGRAVRTGRCSVRTTCTRRWSSPSDCRPIASASCRPRPAAASAARKSIRRCMAGHAALPGAQGRRAGQDDLRPRRGHAGHDQASPVARAASHRRQPRRAPHRDRHRRGAGRRRLLHAEPGGAVARRHSRHRPVPLRPRPHPRPGDDDQHAAQRRLPRLRRAADAVRHRGAHGPDRRRSSASTRCASAP